jgi:RimJ/RimL family protein N-acetyltransferase
VSPELRPFDASLASIVVAWASSPREGDRWASVGEATEQTMARWHAETGVHPFVLVVDGSPRGYGEVWEDPDEDEAELGRVIVDPEVRGRGLGRLLVTLLAERARELGYDQIWVRVVPTNRAATTCYARAGFVRAPRELEAAFNVGQPRRYVWMRLHDDDAGVPRSGP